MKIVEVETLVIGAGLIGSSVAMHLAKLGMTGVRVVDVDLEGKLSSSELNAGGVRGTWIQPVNIQCSKISIDYFAKHAEEVGYRACGYLWLYGEDRLAAALKARERQLSMGWPVEAWDLSELKKRAPFIDKTDGIAGCVYGPRDGLINPNLLKNLFRSEARKSGVGFDDRTWVRGAEYFEGGVEIRCEQANSGLDQDQLITVLSGRTPSEAGVTGISPVARYEEVRYRAKSVVNCAGAWAPYIASILKYLCPSYPVRRQVCIFDCRDVDLTQYGMIIDTSGVYFHPEAMNGLAGIANRNEPHGINYNYDGEEFFMEHIWPPLYERSSAFEKLKHLTGWAGQYEVSPDESAIIGQVEQGEVGRTGTVFEAHSFSGHGAMHSYAVGLGLAERMVKGRYETLDLSELSAQRFETGRLVTESMVI